MSEDEINQTREKKFLTNEQLDEYEVEDIVHYWLQDMVIRSEHVKTFYKIVDVYKDAWRNDAIADKETLQNNLHRFRETMFDTAGSKSLLRKHLRNMKKQVTDLHAKTKLLRKK
jgi:hypothetical protein